MSPATTITIAAASAQTATTSIANSVAGRREGEIVTWRHSPLFSGERDACFTATRLCTDESPEEPQTAVPPDLNKWRQLNYDPEQANAER